MQLHRIIKLIWILSLALLAIQAFYYYSQLPEEIASHFDSSGQPDGFSGKTEFYILWIIILFSVNIWVSLTNLIVKQIPPEYINIPNKKYWLENEERKNRLVQILFSSLGMIFIATNILLIMVFHQIVISNLGGEFDLNVSAIIIPYLFVIAIAITYLLRALMKSNSKK